MTKKKGKGKEAPAAPPADELKTSDDRVACLAVMADVKDIIRHDKNGKGSIIVFAQVRDTQDEKIGTMNLNINNLDKSGIEAIGRALGHKVAMGTPLVCRLEMATGATLDDWNKAKELNEADKQDKAQSKLPEGS